MTISYHWLSEYLPEKIEPPKLSKILTAIGLEVESMEDYEEIKGSLEGLVIGEVLACEKHPDADKLSVTKVAVGSADALTIVCGAANIAAGQKVIVATIGTIIYPAGGSPIAIKKAKIRGIESHGMICAEDEIGIDKSHEGIIVLPDHVVVGTPAAEYFTPYSDIIFEIGLTPNRMDAMSHLGVAKDVCAYLSHHTKKDIHPKLPFKNNFKIEHQGLQMEVVIENTNACERYSGISLQGITIAESPKWLQQKLKSIGLKPINNIVDITNYILHETGQPLHAFDADKIKGHKIIIKNVPEGTSFITLDEKERKLLANDIMICNEQEAMCMGGVLGGLDSGITLTTKNIFLESAWFNPGTIRTTALRHNLRTDAAARFEKGVDISNTVNVLKRAALLIKEIAGGQMASDIIDVYPSPKQKTEIALKYHYLKKLSGKNYHGDTIKNILSSLGFEMIKEGLDELWVKVPFSKPDITIAADLVEEIMRIDGLDNVEIPQMITLAPSAETLTHTVSYQQKIAHYLVAQGFHEIFTNSITNSNFYAPHTLLNTVKMINNLSEELNVLRPSMLETGLQTIVHNLNRKNNNLCFFEFGKIYGTTEGIGHYTENNRLCLFSTGHKTLASWNSKAQKTDFYFVKGIVEKILLQLGLTNYESKIEENEKLINSLSLKINNQTVATIGQINNATAHTFDCKQSVFIADMDWDKIMQLTQNNLLQFTEITKYPSVQRDLSLVVDKNILYQQMEKIAWATQIKQLKNISLFDVFENEKLGNNKKAMAISFTFLDKEKTMTDIQIETLMNKIIVAYQKELNAEIRR